MLQLTRERHCQEEHDHLWVVQQHPDVLYDLLTRRPELQVYGECHQTRQTLQTHEQVERRSAGERAGCSGYKRPFIKLFFPRSFFDHQFQ